MNVLTYLRLSLDGLAREHGASEEGAVATEYVLLLVLIAVAIVGTVGLLAGALDGGFTRAATEVGPAVGGTG